MNAKNQYDIPEAVTDAIRGGDELLTPASFDNGNNRHFVHSSSPDHLVRYVEGVPGYIEGAAYTQKYLQYLHQAYGIRSAKTEYVATALPMYEFAKQIGMEPDPSIITVSEQLHGSIPAIDILTEGFGNAKQELECVWEYDQLLCNIIRHVKDIHTDGGVLSTEFLRLSQFVFIPSNARGRRLVLVDVEPIELSYSSPSSKSPQAVPRDIAQVIPEIAEDVVRLQQTNESLKSSLRSRDALFDLINAVYGSEEPVQTWVREMLQHKVMNDEQDIARYFNTYDLEADIKDDDPHYDERHAWAEYLSTLGGTLAIGDNVHAEDKIKRLKIKALEMGLTEEEEERLALREASFAKIMGAIGVSMRAIADKSLDSK